MEKREQKRYVLTNYKMSFNGMLDQTIGRVDHVVANLRKWILLVQGKKFNLYNFASNSYINTGYFEHKPSIIQALGVNKVICLSSESGQLVIYDLIKNQNLTTLELPSPYSLSLMAGAKPDRLLVEKKLFKESLISSASLIVSARLVCLLEVLSFTDSTYVATFMDIWI